MKLDKIMHNMSSDEGIMELKYSIKYQLYRAIINNLNNRGNYFKRRGRDYSKINLKI